MVKQSVTLLIDNTMPPKSIISIKSSDTIFICRCWASASFPLCDGSHKTIEDGRCGPVKIIIEKDDIL